MDTTFLNYFTRLSTWPPFEPWAAEYSLNYYAFGYYILGSICKILSIPYNTSYWLCFALIFALTSELIFMFFLRLSSWNIKKSLLLTTLFLFISNVASFLKIFPLSDIKNNNITSFWMSSRVFTEGRFVEWPIWSFVFGDLHPHVIALPFIMAFIILLYECYISSFKNIYILFLFGFSFGVLFGLNFWDLIFYSFFLIFLLLFFHKRPSPKKFIFIFIGTIISSIPFVIFYTRILEDKSSEKLINISGYNSVIQVFSHLGILLLAVIIWQSKTIKLKNIKKSLILLSFIPLLLGLLLLLALHNFSSVPWTIFIFQTIFLLFLSFSFDDNDDSNLFDYFIFFAVLAIGFLEAFTIHDRFNTIFKFYYPIWMILSLGIFAKIASANLKFSWRNGLLCILILPALIGTGQIIHSYYISANDKTMNTNICDHYYKYLGSPSEKAMIDWINTNIKEQVNIIEAYGNSYSNAGRISTFTGLPTVLVQEYHVFIHRVPSQYIQTTKNLIKDFYETNNIENAKNILKDFNVKYFIISDLEWASYHYLGLMKFLNSSDFKIIWHQGRSYLIQLI